MNAFFSLYLKHDGIWCSELLEFLLRDKAVIVQKHAAIECSLRSKKVIVCGDGSGIDNCDRACDSNSRIYGLM